MNMQGLLKQAQKMQKDLVKLENELNTTVYEESIGGGAVVVSIKGSMEINAIQIEESLLTVDAKDDLEDMLKMALNHALEKAKADKEKKMNTITGGMKMPGGF